MIEQPKSAPRRAIIGLLAAAGLLRPLAAAAQKPTRMVRVGWIGNSPLTTPDTIAPWDSFRLELQRLGWTEGRQVAFTLRFADGDADRYAGFAREMIEGGMDVIVATGGVRAPRAVGEATSTIPIIFTAVPDPVAEKLVSSLARPGGNLTGLATMSTELIGKRLDLLRDAFPGVQRIAYLTSGAPWAAITGEIAAGLGLQWTPVEVRRLEDLPGAIAARSGVDAWFIEEHTPTIVWRSQIASLLAGQRKPAMYPMTLFVESGGLLAYGVDFITQGRRAAWYVDKILRGAPPSMLPVERPNTFELAVNLRAAREQGLTIPPGILLRADVVIE